VSRRRAKTYNLKALYIRTSGFDNARSVETEDVRGGGDACVVVWIVVVCAGAHFCVDAVDGAGTDADENVVACRGRGFGDCDELEIGDGAVGRDGDGAHGFFAGHDGWVFGDGGLVLCLV
jgi:hypothetical protein